MMNIGMKKLKILWNILSLVVVEVNSLEIKMDPGMREGQPSYIYCDVGTVTAGVTFYTEPGNLKENCLAPGAGCSSNLYTVTQNTTGVRLGITSVNISREEGVWYCEHDTDRSNNTISLNDHTIAGILLDEGWTEPSGAVDTFYAVMTLSCTNKVPNVSFAYEDSKSNTGNVPTEAVSMTNQSLYDGTTCENGNKFYEITLTASNRLDIFNNKQGVKFSFTYYGKNITAPFSVDFKAFSESTTESPNTTAALYNTTNGDNPTTDEMIIIVSCVVGGLVVVVLVVVVGVLVHKYGKKKVHSQDQKEQAMTTPAEPKRISSNL